MQRARRAVLPLEEGSAAGPLPTYIGNKEGRSQGMGLHWDPLACTPVCLSPMVCCSTDSCRLSRDPGPCSGMLSRFFYNSSSMACETFLYGGCLGNGNNFYSEKECLQACRTEGENPGWAQALEVPLPRHHKGSEHCLECHVSMWEVWGSLDPPPHAAPVPAAACRLPVVPGPCQARVTRWAFDAAQGKCITFSYGGCKGNGNQFYSEKECKEYCGAPQLAGIPLGPHPRAAACTTSCPALLLPEVGTGLSWLWRGLGWVHCGPGMGLSWVQDQSGSGMGLDCVLCPVWVILSQDGPRMGVSLGWDGFVMGP